MQKTCQRIKSSGARCRAVALTSSTFCFWHARIHRHDNGASREFPDFYCPENTVANRKDDAEVDDAYAGLRANYPISNELPPLEDAESIQISISLIVRALADARIEHKSAALMLYALQIAANNVRAVRPAIEDSVEHIATNDAGVEIAIDSVASDALVAPEALAIPEAPAIPEITAQPASDIPPKLLLTEVQSQPLAQAA
jgi:hypothetical protein